jgi:hypothetical protein
VLDVVPASISIERPADDTHDNPDDSDLDIEPDAIAAMPPPTEVSILLATCPVSEIVPGSPLPNVTPQSQPSPHLPSPQEFESQQASCWS